jgi:MoxR-like ATPase
MNQREPEPRRPFERLVKDGMTGQLGKPYDPSADLLEAVNVALACEMPLLLTGEPGCGKTDLAWAVASVLDRDRDDGRDRSLLECHVRSDTRARDLLYHYDAVRRFGDGQVADPEAQARAREPANYVTLRPLGCALVSSYRRVVLIDEIDKAQRDLPNDLLRALDERKFEIPELVARESDESGGTGVRSHGHELRATMTPPRGAERSLLLITSNVERQLPEPFLRRCVFYHIGFPHEERLGQILEAHFPDVGSAAREKALKVFLKLRRVPRLTKKPATAELLVWVQALTTVFDGGERSLDDFAAWVDDPASRPEPGWRRLPGLSSLLKLREDLETAGVGGETAAGGAVG